MGTTDIYAKYQLEAAEGNERGDQDLESISCSTNHTRSA